ncbi:hypothetical protein [Xenorhabdus sp. PB30.3]|uniref:hypothetical protein n=1 Tax=Xenorhabdus sp. PB30.3 TaxID=2788941 RepID=UPI001E37DB30|nr:hypothetical protein [Xenorhabdus sp. PB30.3]MCC8381603.1 hypothetical protein [Xenorhabdus sp. PB30.3]
MRFNNIFKTIVFLLAFSVGSASAFDTFGCIPGQEIMEGYVNTIYYDYDYKDIFFTLTNAPHNEIAVRSEDEKINNEQRDMALRLLIDARNNDHQVSFVCKNGAARYILTYYSTTTD